jgi:hypothetical protein
MTSSNVTQTPIGQHGKKTMLTRPSDLKQFGQGTNKKFTYFAYLTSSWMTQGILWNKQSHIKWDLNNPKMEINWAQS